MASLESIGFDLLKSGGGMSIGALAVYFLYKIKDRSPSNGNGISHVLQTQAMATTLTEIKTILIGQKELLQQLVNRRDKS